jgi:hypothetical protein
MTDLEECLNRLIVYFEKNQQYGVLPIKGHTIVSDSDDDSDAYKDTLALIIEEINYTGTPNRYVVKDEVTGDEQLLRRFEPQVTIKAVYSGQNAQMNAALHEIRVRKALAQYTDLKLVSHQKFINATPFFETRYIKRFQAEGHYLCYFDVYTGIETIDTVSETLEGYLSSDFKELLTKREIEIKN